MNRRDAARLVLLNEFDEVLLVKYSDESAADPKKNVLSYWVPPGGGVHAGESFLAAALRELLEETGIQIAQAQCVWLRERELMRKGELTLYHEEYFLARVVGRPVPTLVENTEGIVECRWHSLESIGTSGEVFFPDGFARLLAPLIAGIVPSEPIFVEHVSD